MNYGVAFLYFYKTLTFHLKTLYFTCKGFMSTINL